VSFEPPRRILLGPGPSTVPPRVLEALGKTTLSHLDPVYLGLLEEVQQRLRRVFRTDNEATLFLPGTGTSGMEAAVVNLVEPGEVVVAGVAGYFGARLAEVAERQGATVKRVEAPWGEVLSAGAMAAELARHEKVAAVLLVHAETSTGAHQPVEPIARLAKEAGALLIVDAVTSLGGVPVEVDAWGIDACYSCSQKCLSAPPGLAPITFSPRALEKIAARQSPCRSFYLDLGQHLRYWGPERMYHHTAPSNLGYALLEGLKMLEEEGLEGSFARHRTQHERLRQGLEALGLRYIPSRSLPHLNAVLIPEGVDDLAIRKRLLADYGIEIGAGLGPFKGRAFRIGIMGASCTAENVDALLAALGEILA
jgi:alanine-glyoxylate transaminase/serine-glyoxylate transaminase/serine-pyruvate transaminase